MTLSPFTAVVAALLVSLAGNVVLGRGYVVQRDHAREALAQAERNLDVAKQCSASVQQLEQDGRVQRAAAEVELKAARAKSLTLQRQAQVLAARPATQPGNDCGSAQDRIDRWMRER